MVDRIAWRFYDPVTLDEYFMEVNPAEDSGSHAIVKNTRYEAAVSTYKTSANALQVNAVVAHAAPKEQETFAYNGKVYTLEQYYTLILWFNKDYPFQIRDDLGREHLCFVDTFTVERVRSRQHRWKHSYSVSGIILEEV